MTSLGARVSGPRIQVAPPGQGSGGATFQPAAFAEIPPLVEICGEIDVCSASELRDELLRVIRQRGPRLMLDLTGVTFIDCAGVNVLLATRRRAQLEGGSVEVVRASPKVRRMISLLGLGWAFGPR